MVVQDVHLQSPVQVLLMAAVVPAVVVTRAGRVILLRQVAQAVPVVVETAEHLPLG